MIREFKQTDIDNVMEIWITENIRAHDFIPKEYWKKNFEYVKKILPKLVKKENIIMSKLTKEEFRAELTMFKGEN